MSRQLLLRIIVLACFAGVVAPAIAEDLNPPPWDQSLPNQTYQAWDSRIIQPGQPTIFPEPSTLQNPYGEPWVTLQGTWDNQMIPGPRGNEIVTWHVGEPGGQLVIHVPNLDQNNPVKRIFWQITADKSVTPTGNPPTTVPPGTAQPAPYPQIQWPVDNWYTYNGLLEIRPNPASEDIIFNLVPSTDISEIVIKTVCEPVPEPSTLVLLGMGTIGLLGFAWRRRK